MAPDTDEENAKGICQDYRAAAVMWVRIFELRVAQGRDDFEACRSFADAAVVAAHQRGAWFYATAVGAVAR